MKTGYILQQCALANNIAHFKMVMDSVSCTDEDLLYQDAETGEKDCPSYGEEFQYDFLFLFNYSAFNNTSPLL